VANDTDAGWPLEKMAEFERTIGSLYAAFADGLPEHREFWEALSAEEEQHASWIEGFSDLGEAGVAKISAFTLSMREIDEGIDFVKKELGKAMQQSFGNDRALDVALLVERSILERKYYSVVRDPTDAVAKLLASLEDGTREHLLRLEAAREGRRPSASDAR